MSLSRAGSFVCRNWPGAKGHDEDQSGVPCGLAWYWSRPRAAVLVWYRADLKSGSIVAGLEPGSTVCGVGSNAAVVELFLETKVFVLVLREAWNWGLWASLVLRFIWVIMVLRFPANPGAANRQQH